MRPLVAGIYPLLSDDCCYFWAVDFDEETWVQDSKAFIDTCHTENIHAYMERSRSGNGGHVWIFLKTKSRRKPPVTLARCFSQGHILVHRAQLMEQWVERIAIFFQISKKEIGQISGTKKKRFGKIDVALIRPRALCCQHQKASRRTPQSIP